MKKPTIEQAAKHLLEVWESGSKAKRNALKRKYNELFDPIQFAEVFKRIQTH